MNRLILQISMLVFAVSPALLKAQAPCQVPINNVQFQQNMRSISAVPAGRQRLNRALQVVRTNCLSTLQLAEIMRLFPTDGERLDVSSTGLNAITDAHNAYLLFDEFSRFSSAFLLYDMINGFRAPLIQEVVEPPVPVPVPIVEEVRPVMSFPVLNYPAIVNYSGPRNCDSYLAENDFMVFAQDIFNRLNEVARYEGAVSLVSRTCLSTAQAMKLSTFFSIENNRLEFLKLAYPRIFDEANYDQAQQVFNHPPNKMAFAEFLRAKRVAALPPPPPPCAVTPDQFRMLRETLAREGSSSSRVTIAKNQIPVMRCFTSQQMKEILNLYASSIDRLDVAKFAYAYIIDKDVYFMTVSSLFNSSIDRESLSNFVTNNR